MTTVTETRTLGRYVLCDEIASGGMATVHIGRLLGPVGFARTVAIKRLHPQFAKDPEFVAMFLDEARLAARVRHPNVAATIDVVVLKGELFVVMEYVHGESLSRLIRASRAATGAGVPPAIALTVVANALYGLHAAHEATNEYGAPLAIVHRDVSPQNILVGQDGAPRVVDFGVAKATDRLQTTREGGLKGKLAYMSPEQVSSATVDRRTDIYAASVVLWEALTGHRLHAADSEVGLIQAVLQSQVRPPSAVAPHIRPEIDALVMRGLARDPAERFQTAAEMAEAAQQLAFATPGQIGAWVKSLGGHALEERAARVAFIESNSAQSGREIVSDDSETTTLVHDPANPANVIKARSLPPAPVPLPSAISSANTVEERPKRIESEAASQVSAFIVSTPVSRTRVSVILAVVLPALAIGGLAALLLARGLREPEAAPVTSASVVAAAAPPAPEAPAPSATASAFVESPSIAVSSLPAASADEKAAKPRDRRPPPTRGKNCTPPYTVDARGIRVPKMECL